MFEQCYCRIYCLSEYIVVVVLYCCLLHLLLLLLLWWCSLIHENKLCDVFLKTIGTTKQFE